MRFYLSFNLNGRAKVFIIVLLLTCIAIYGCAAPKIKIYPGDKLEDSKHAVIRGDEIEEEYSGILILKVDDKWTINPFLRPIYIDGAGAGEVYVLPGKHRLSIKVHYQISEAMASLWLIAEPGGKYVIKAIANGSTIWDRRSVQIWIENERSGQAVGGIVGSDDEPNE